MFGRKTVGQFIALDFTKTSVIRVYSDYANIGPYLPEISFIAANFYVVCTYLDELVAYDQSHRTAVSDCFDRFKDSFSEACIIANGNSNFPYFHKLIELPDNYIIPIPITLNLSSVHIALSQQQQPEDEETLILRTEEI
ncbi:MAG: hypothetical protein Q9223_001830 [Gallowayella weberi]